MRSSIHLSILAILAISGSTLGTLSLPRAVFPLTRAVKTTNITNIVNGGKERAASFKAAAGTGAAPAINLDVVYTVATQVGTQTFQLIVDTGSANICVGGATKYIPGPTSTSTGVTISFGSCVGKEYYDKVSLAGFTVARQLIGVSTGTGGFEGYDGTFGFGPVDLTEGTVLGFATVPTFLDNLYKQGSINPELLGIRFAPESGSDTNDQNGELSIGGLDSAKFTGSIIWTPKSTVSPYSYYWGVTVTSVTYGSTSLFASAPAIVDTATTLVYIPTAAYTKFLSATGGKTDATSGLAVFTTQPTGNVTFKIGSGSFSLTPSQYLVPTTQYSVFGLTSGKYYAWINDGGSATADVNFIIGQKFLENYYSAYDTTNGRIGFATTT